MRLLRRLLDVIGLRRPELGGCTAEQLAFMQLESAG